jgi:predicted Abi (CAAX) family protease
MLCHIKLLNLKYLFAPICAFHLYAVGYKVYHHPQFLLTGLYSIGCKRK